MLGIVRASILAAENERTKRHGGRAELNRNLRPRERIGIISGRWTTVDPLLRKVLSLDPMAVPEYPRGMYIER